MYKSIFKRLLDLVLVVCAIIMLSPIMIISALAIKLEDGRNVIFKQKRIGKNGEFYIYKFRSMKVDTGDIPSAQVGNAQITNVGKVIRRTNIDELPQLFNIYFGQMSIVGPRPALAIQKELNTMRRMNGASMCKPGLTGLAQVHSYDGMPEVEKAKWDGIYASQITFWKDVKIIIKTFGYLLSRPPVY
ncbi:MAG: sugar transferase [Pelosinus sp.]|nr:sugar transferase [Pelosinus sp.]